MAVTLDATGSEGAFTTAATTHNYTGLTISGGLTNSAAIFGVIVDPSAGGTAGGTITATWNGVSCTNIIQLDTSHTAGSVALFGIVNPASGNQTFSITTVNSCQAAIVGVSFSGVNQTGGTTSFANSTSKDLTIGTSSSTTMTVTTANGDYTFCMGSYGTDGTGAGMSPGQFFIDNAGGTGNFGGTLGLYPCGAKNAETTSSRTYTLSNVTGTNDILYMAALDIVAAAASGADGSTSQTIYKLKRSWF